MKRGLAFISAPQFLLQSLWFCSLHPEVRFDAFILTSDISDEAGEGLIRQCKACGCFEEVILSTGFRKSNLGVKVGLFLRMLFYFCTGRRSVLTAQFINNEINGTKYHTIVVDNECSVIGGAFIDNSNQEYDVYIMQDGVGDLMKRERFPRSGISEFAFWLVAKMGYCNPGFHYTMEKTKFCSKITTFGAQLTYRPYKKILEMDLRQTNPRFERCLSNAYGLDTLSEQDAQVVLLTTDFDNMKLGAEVVGSMRSWLRERYSGQKIILKKHPRDICTYDWPEFSLQEIDPSIPAELLFPLFRGKTIISAFPSTAIAELMNLGIDYRVICFQFVDDSTYRRGFASITEELNIPDENIIVIEQE